MRTLNSCQTCNRTDDGSRVGGDNLVNDQGSVVKMDSFLALQVQELYARYEKKMEDLEKTHPC